MDERNVINRSKPGRAALRQGRYSQPGRAYLITSTTRDREAVFNDFTAACTAAACFQAPLLGDSRMLAWVLMPDHVHWLISLGQTEDLSLLVGRLKSASARHVNRRLNRQAPLWDPSFHDRALRRDSDLVGAARYVVANPLRAGLCTRLGDYPFWDAVWL